MHLILLKIKKKKTSGSGIKNENISNKESQKNYRNQLLKTTNKYI